MSWKDLARRLVDDYFESWAIILRDYWFIPVFILGLFLAAGINELIKWRKAQ